MSVRRTTTRSSRAAMVSFAIAMVCALTLVSAGSAGAEATAVGLGAASSFAVIGGSTVTNTGPSVIGGDLGVSPGTAVDGFPPGLVLDGTTHSADALAASAQADATTAYNALAAEATSVTISADLGGTTLDPGVYTGTSLGLTGTVTLDAHGDPNAAFVFQAATTLTTASASAVSLIGGATACNVYWQIGSSATLGTNSVFVGTLLSQVSITATTGAIVAGRLLAKTGAVTLDSNTVTKPTCSPVTTTTTSPTTTAPVTTTPVTTAPTTTPATTAPATTAPATTAPATTAPATTAPATTRPATSAPTPTTSSNQLVSPPGLVVTPPTRPGSTTSTTTRLEVTPPTRPGSTTVTTTGLEVTPPTLTEAEASAMTMVMRQTSEESTPSTTVTTTTELARTGSDVSGLFILGLMAMGIGIALTFAARRSGSEGRL